MLAAVQKTQRQRRPPSDRGHPLDRRRAGRRRRGADAGKDREHERPAAGRARAGGGRDSARAGHRARHAARRRSPRSKRALESDFVLSSGGVSVGAFDFVKDALDALGAETKFWRVAMKPGKPVVLSRLRDRVILGLPGNPVSSFVSFHLFAAPALRKAMGQEGDLFPARRARAPGSGAASRSATAAFTSASTSRPATASSSPNRWPRRDRDRSPR